MSEGAASNSQYQSAFVQISHPPAFGALYKRGLAIKIDKVLLFFEERPLYKKWSVGKVATIQLNVYGAKPSSVLVGQQRVLLQVVEQQVGEQ